MRLWTTLLLLAILVAGACSLLLAQKPWVEYPGQSNGYGTPEDYKVPREWVFARLRYNSYGGYGGFRGRSSWGTDYPRGDRLFVEGLKRITRIDARSVEQVVDLDGTPDIYNWPFLYAVEVGRWGLDPNEAKQLRDYLDRGGFLMVDDFHGTEEWAIFVESMQRVFPDRPIVDIPNSDAIFHVLHDLDDRIQVPGRGAAYGGRTYERDGYEARWRAVYDDKGRIQVAICHNMDLGDALEYSNDPGYPEKFAGMAFRIAANYITYDLTH